MGTKGDLQRQRIIDSASYCLANFGERGTTFQTIADHCKISQSSVVKYLKTRDNIFPQVLDYWISRARVQTEARLNASDSAEQKLRHYIKVSHELFVETREVSIIILTLHYLAGTNEKYRVVNAGIKEVALNRIAKIIDEGIQDGSFKKVNSRIVAKTMHNSLMGYLLSTISEPQLPESLHLPDALTELCLSMVLPTKA